MGFLTLGDTLPTMPSIVPVVLSGGVGTRLWPLSRQAEPKQFQALIGSESMLAQTLARLPEYLANAIVVANVAHVGELSAHAGGIRILAEPEGRNTAPAVAAAALTSDADDILVVMPADHHIAQVDEFRKALTLALDTARAGYLTTFGIVPGGPETGFGYIVPGESALDGDDLGAARRIEKFVEKPSIDQAKELIQQGALWNSGMFVFPISVLLEELGRLEPELLRAVQSSLASSTENSWGRLLGREFSDAKSVAIDVAVMERTHRAAVVPLSAGWSDIGSWASLWELGEKDRAGNVVVGPVTMHQSSGSYVRSEGPRIAVSGADDLVIVATATSVLVTKRENAQSVKTLFEMLAPEDR